MGFNNAATDPGTQQIRANLEIAADFSVDPNGGGAIVIPDVKGRQVIVVGTADDVNIAEDAIRLIDRRPKQVHIQAVNRTEQPGYPPTGRHSQLARRGSLQFNNGQFTSAIEIVLARLRFTC